ncbi:MAG: beta-N-acetylhexosaminidase [Proteobacteria bacterium]|nr:beta-N-acetylhexosaminidase [Pseudomonadota bacterium]
MLSNKAIAPLVVGIPGTTVDPDTRAVLAALNPVGFILFKRNCESREQVEALCKELTGLCPMAQKLIFIDQEGGRVNRILWEPYMAPPGATIGALYHRNQALGLRAAELNGYIIAAQLATYGITVDCLPVADIAVDGADAVIGDRAFSKDPKAVAALCAATMKGLLAGGVWPVIKHAPGHGRAMADSHKELPVVKTDATTLEAVDFVPFAINNRAPFVMTAHIRYDAYDAKACATESTIMVNDVLRDKLGMSGLIVSDDLNMQALAGDTPSRARRALAAGCDLLLHCNGNLDELRSLVGVTELSEQARKAIENLPSRGLPRPDSLMEAVAEMRGLLSDAAA